MGNQNTTEPVNGVDLQQICSRLPRTMGDVLTELGDLRRVQVAAQAMAGIIETECAAKHSLDPREDEWSEDYGLSLTITVGEAKKFLQAILPENKDIEHP